MNPQGMHDNHSQGMYPMSMGGTSSSNPNGQNWNANMMNRYQMMNPMFQGSGVFGPYGYIPPAGPQNYKTKKCRHYETGRCKLAGLCNFAHGDEELRSASDK